MKKIINRTERPDTFDLMATWLQKIFPECEICISDFNRNANDP